MNLTPRRFAVEAIPPQGNETSVAATVVVDKPAHSGRAYNQDGNLLAFHPASIGSEEKPAPTGAFKIRRVEWNPDYLYDPRFAWKGVKTKRKLVVAAGPNNPVGLAWIDLSAPSYGIHGTPSPEAIGKAEITRLHPPDQLERGRPRRHGAPRDGGQIRG